MERINLSIKNELSKTILNDPNIGKFYRFKHWNTKYSLEQIIDDILYVLKTGISWRDIRSSINWSTIFFHHSRFCKFNIYRNTYRNILNFYFDKIKTINGIIIDSSFFQNKFGKNNIARNKFF